MRTEIGQEVLNEISTELNQELKERKTEIALKQGGSLFKSLIMMVEIYLRILLLIIILSLVLVIFTANESAVITMLEATPKEIVEGINLILSLSIALSFFFSIIWFVVKRNRTFRNVNGEMKLDNERELETLSFDVDLIEELLHRHNLIEGEK